jgi:DnaJ-class molecular chaperone
MTLYEVLQVSETACPEVIDAAWKALLKLCHPDLHPDMDHRVAQTLNQAHDILSDPAQRNQYDTQLAASRMTPQFTLSAGGFGLSSMNSFVIFERPFGR